MASTVSQCAMRIEALYRLVMLSALITLCGLGLGSRGGRYAGWQDGKRDLGLLARQRLQKARDLVDLIVCQLRPQLAVAHDRNGLAKIPRLARVEIGWRKGDIPQRGNPEHILVARRLGHLEAALVVWRKYIGTGALHHPERGVHAATHVHAAMTGRAALVLSLIHI